MSPRATALRTPEPLRQPVALPSAAEWARVSRVQIQVRQEYRYAYPAPATHLAQRLVMLPPEHYGDQHVIAHTFTVGGAPNAIVRAEADGFGNQIRRVLAPVIPDTVSFAVDFTIERSLDGPPPRLLAGPSLGAYLSPTALTAPCDPIRHAVREIAELAAAGGGADLAAATVSGPLSDIQWARLDAEGRRQWIAARLAGEWAARSITYQFGVTGVQTPAAMALHLGRGVCQDYAHIGLALLRQLRIPCRYVSGHVLGEGAPHAWLEALLPDPDAPGQVRAVAYDPTHKRAPRLDYITVATGRDYADVPPTSGSFSGAMGRFTATKDAWIVELA